MPIKKISTIDSWIQDHSPMREAELMVRLSNPKPGARFGTLTRQQQEQAQTEAKQLERDLQTALQQSEEEPVPAPYAAPLANDQKYLWFFKGDVYDVESVMRRHPGYSDEQIQLLILEYFDRERRKFEKLKRLYKSDSIQHGIRRERIPEHIRIAVWRRDGGKCARCGSREKLEYDHIVPVSKGGSNTERNIELLCERCNREKGDRIE
jgi:hypothetical protein